MARNFSPSFIKNKNCFGCSQIIWWSDTLHKYTSDPDGKEVHFCVQSQPKTRRSEVTAEQIDSISRQVISIAADLAMLRKAVHEIGGWVQELRH